MVSLIVGNPNIVGSKVADKKIRVFSDNLSDQLEASIKLRLPLVRCQLLTKTPWLP
jgi:hypothetical protein